ncbi:MAG TPA: histidine phosphatase family protein [Myxococcota bacterium]|nr:histidine phosphatase family protein [Myxococcota bacterium]
MTTSPWVIPPSTLRWLEEIPTDRPVAMLIRHSVRGPLPEGDAGYHLPITEAGHELARTLGARLRGRLRGAHASPLLRTMQTAERLLEGARLPGPVTPDTLLGDPGVFMLDGRAGPYWRGLGQEQMLTHLVEDRPPLPGCAAADPAARFLVHHMLGSARGVPGVYAFATHDSLVTTTAARMLVQPLGRPDWPWYLEAAFFWEADGHVQVAYRDHRGARPAPIVGLTEDDVVALARREAAATVGLECPARFFLAGGAFKTLLTGRPPRDLDLWAPSADDRAVLEATLLQRGAEPLPERAYTQAFRLGPRVVELPLHTEPNTLEERLSRFDLALSAVGAEHLPGDRWRAAIHPLALASVKQRQVLLLDELKNWRHGLTSIERLRRYAGELAFEAPACEEARLWSIFDSQSPEVQAVMVQHFRRSARHDQGVAEDLFARGVWS